VTDDEFWQHVFIKENLLIVKMWQRLEFAFLCFIEQLL